MENKLTRNWVLTLSGFFLLTLLGLGMWWLFLLLRLNKELTAFKAFADQKGHVLLDSVNILSLVKWEGTFFLVILMAISVSFIFLYYRDQKKTRAMQAFFASLTHELKTPLTSIRLHSQVMDNHLSHIEENKTNLKLQELSKRLLEDTHSLENEMDKILQLSRMEQGGNLSLIPIDLDYYLDHIKKVYEHKVKINLESVSSEKDSHHYDKEPTTIMADEMALNLIFRNLIENSILHNKNKQNENLNIDLKIQQTPGKIKLTYNDHGQKFLGDRKKVGKLFYKHDSSKGSGIGLYLCKKLMKKMNGTFTISFPSHLVFELTFPTQDLPA